MSLDLFRVVLCCMVLQLIATSPETSLHRNDWALSKGLGQEFGKIYTPPTRASKKDLEQTVMSNLKGIVLVSSKEDLLDTEALHKIKGVECRCVELPGPCSELQADLSPFLGKTLTLESIEQIRKTITRFYQSYFHSLILIEVPTQNVSPSVLQLILLESKLGEIKIEGNQKWSNFNSIRKTMQLKPNQFINDRVLTADLNFLNRGAYREVNAIYEPTAKEGVTDLLLLVHDNDPYQFFVGTDNTGIKTTRTTLYYGGVNFGNCFGLGHTLGYQYTTSNFHALQAHVGQYIAPLPNLHIVNVFGGYAQVYPQIVFPAASNFGYALQTSFRYLIPLLPTWELRHDIGLGFDYKRTNTNQIYSSDTALSPFNQTINLTQVVVTYSGVYNKADYLLAFDAEVYFSPMEWIAQQSNHDYSQLRPGAKNRWIYMKAGFAYYKRLSYGFYTNMSIRGQISSTTLLPSEQFGLGGFDTVRGYDERIVNYDNAILLSVELHTPTWKITNQVKKSSPLSDGLQLLAFFDYAWGINHVLMPGEPHHEFLGGAGPAIRYFLDSYLSCRFDYGFKLQKSAVLGTNLGFFHFSVTASY